jgi:hypothetical protein
LLNLRFGVFAAQIALTAWMGWQLVQRIDAQFAVRVMQGLQSIASGKIDL